MRLGFAGAAMALAVTAAGCARDKYEVTIVEKETGHPLVGARVTISVPSMLELGGHATGTLDESGTMRGSLAHRDFPPYLTVRVHLSGDAYLSGPQEPQPFWVIPPSTEVVGRYRCQIHAPHEKTVATLSGISPSTGAIMEKQRFESFLVWVERK